MSPAIVALVERGSADMAAHRPADALAVFAQALAARPDLAVMHFNLGCAQEALGRDALAVAAYQQAVQRDTALTDAQYRLASLLHAHGDLSGAMSCYRQVAAREPNTTRGMRSRAELLMQKDDPEGAEKSLRQAAAQDPASADIARMLATILRERGAIAEATMLLERAIALDPAQVLAYHGLVTSRRMTTADHPLIAQMQAVLHTPGLLDQQRIVLNFALGKALDDLGEYAGAIRYFDAANALARRRMAFNRAQFAGGVDQLIATFTAAAMAKAPAIGSASELPIVIVGMVRSGTTVVEQIVSSHKAIAGAGELGFWYSAAAAFGQSGLAEMTADYARRVAGAYVAQLRHFAPAAARVIDKMPGNFLWLGLIHLAFPNARIIHCRRHPVDTCLSIYFTPFGARQEHAYDRGDLAFYYKHYARLMDHWRAALPPDRFLEVDYEQLVADPEKVSRRLIAFAGMDWDDACLRPDQNRRRVKTASVWQVRQPIYTASVARWRNYRPWLGELEQLLLPADAGPGER